jgi:hypothetical protein
MRLLIFDSIGKLSLTEDLDSNIPPTQYSRILGETMKTRSLSTIFNMHPLRKRLAIQRFDSAASKLAKTAWNTSG